MSMNNEKEKAFQAADSSKYVKTTKAQGARKYGKFNFIDALLILIVIAAIIIVASYFLPEITSGFTRNDDVKITYVVEFKGVDNDFVTKIKTENKVFEASKNYGFGTVKAVENDNYNILVYNETSGVAELKPHPEFKNIIVTVECIATYVDGEGYSVSGERIAVGKQLNLRFPEFSGSGYCIDIKISDAQ